MDLTTASPYQQLAGVYGMACPSLAVLHQHPSPSAVTWARPQNTMQDVFRRGPAQPDGQAPGADEPTVFKLTEVIVSARATWTSGTESDASCSYQEKFLPVTANRVGSSKGPRFALMGSGCCRVDCAR